MRICWIKAGGIVPLDFGGRIRSYHMLRALAKRHPVTFATFYRKEAGLKVDPHEELAPMFEKLVLLPMDLPVARTKGDYLLYLKTMFSGFPHSIAKYHQPQVKAAIKKLLTENQFDVLVCDFIFPVGVIDWDLPVKKVLFTHNVEAEVWERQAKVASSLALRVASRLEHSAMTKAERKYVNLADHVVAVSQANKNVFATYRDAKDITVVSTGVDAEFFQPRPEAHKPNHVAFTGSYDWAPNADAMEWYFNEILPLVKREIPDVETWAVGKSPTGFMKRAAEQDPKFHVTGRVDDIRPFMDQASLYIVPMRSGSGTRLKVFEAMASGKAIVSTPTGAEGLPVEDGKSVLFATSAEEFAAKMVRALRDAQLRTSLGNAARQLVEGRYSWERVGEEFEAILERTLKGN